MVLRKPLVLTILSSALISLAILGGVVWYRRHAPAPPTVTLGADRRPATRHTPPPLTPSSTPGASPTRIITLNPPYAIVDGLTVRSTERTVRLADLEVPPREAICFDEKGHLWACGLQARAALNNLITERAIVCKVVARENDMDVGHCQVDQADLGRRLVAAGWARPIPDRQAAYTAELSAASEAKAGIWNGGWRIRPPLKPN